jgi:hypothetical protein
MSKFLPTFIALLILGGLAWYVVRYEQEPLSEKVIPKVVMTEKDKIAKVVLEEVAKKTELVLEKNKDSKWEISAPLQALPEDEKLDSLLNRLEKVKADRLLEPPAGQKHDLAQYGLDTPTHKVTWTAGEASHTLLIGKDNPLGSSAYVKLAASEQVFLVNSGDLEILKKDLFAFRDKTVLKADREQVKELRVEKAGGEKWRFTHGADGKWTVEEPFKAPGDAQVIGDMVGDLGRLKAEEFTAETTADLAPFGLDKPELVAKLVLKDDGATKTVLFGKRKPTDSNRIYAMRESEPKVYLVDATLIKALGNQPIEFRDKTVFSVEGREIVGLAVEKQGEKVAASRGKDGRWSFEAARCTTDPGASLTVLLDKLKELKAARFVTGSDVKLGEFGLEKPDYALTLSLAAAAPTTAATGAAAPQPVELKAIVGKSIDQGRFVKLGDDPAVIVTKEEFVTAFDAFFKTYRELLTFDDWNMKSLEVTSKGKKHSFEINDKGDWLRQGDKEAVAPLKDKLRAFAGTLPHLAPTGWETETKEALAAAGLDQPAFEVTVTTKDGQPAQKLLLASAGGKTHVKLEGKPGLGTIEKAPYDRAGELVAADEATPATPVAQPATPVVTGQAAPAPASSGDTPSVTQVSPAPAAPVPPATEPEPEKPVAPAALPGLTQELPPPAAVTPAKP